MSSGRTIQARVSPDLWSWLERYRRLMGCSRSAVIVDALELLRLEDASQRVRRGQWELVHQLREELWRAQARFPAEVSERLQGLVRSLDVAREDLGPGVVLGSTSEKELIAALIHDAPTSRRALEAKLSRYRTAQRGAREEASARRGARPDL